jgi:hypothetical protein
MRSTTGSGIGDGIDGDGTDAAATTLGDVGADVIVGAREAQAAVSKPKERTAAVKPGWVLSTAVSLASR